MLDYRRSIEQWGGSPTSLSDVFQALGDPHRRHILRQLAGGERSAGELAATLPLTKPSVSHHLAVLRHAGLVRDERRGQRIVYSLDTSVLQDALVWAMDLTGATGAGTGTKSDDSSDQGGPPDA